MELIDKINEFGSLTNYIKLNQNNLLNIKYDGNYKLENNIVLRELINISVSLKLESGELFEGNGYSIDLSGLNINGFFESSGNMLNNCKISNLKIINNNGSCFIKSGISNFELYNCIGEGVILQENIGGLIGENCSNYEILNSIYSGKIDALNSSGICGLSNNGTINNCIFNGILNKDNSSGIAGKGFIGVIENSYSVCNLDKLNTGGILGINNESVSGSCLIKNCYQKHLIKDNSSFSITNNQDYITYENIYSIELNNLEEINGSIGLLGDNFVIDNYDYKQYPLLKCFREIPWKRDSYENYNQVPDLASSLRDLLNSGYSEQELKEIGYTIQDFRQEKYTVTELVELGFTLKQISENGYTTAEILSEGYTMPMILEDVVNIEDLTYGNNKEKVFELISENIDGKLKKVFKLLRDIRWVDINEITPSVDYISLKANEILDGNNRVLDLSGVSTRGIISTNGTSIEDCSIIRNLNINGGLISHNDFYDQGNSILVRKEMRYFIIENCNLVTNIHGEFSGGLCGMYSGFEEGHCIIRNCEISGNIIGSHAGGLVGASAGNSKGLCEIINCKSYGNIIGNGSGGIVGFASGNGSGSCIIKDCIHKGNIEGNRSGGIVGSHSGNRGNCEIRNSSCEGNINGGWSGGIIGENAGYKGTCTIYSCDYKGIINNEYCGGIVGMNCGYMGICNIDLCILENITIDGSYCGGITGGNAGVAGRCNITRCKISINSNIIGFGCGGIVGGQSGKNDGICNISKCLFEGNINGNENGGIAGSYAGNSGNTSIERCQYIGNINGNGNGCLIGSYGGYNGSLRLIKSCSSGNINGINNGGLCGIHNSNKNSSVLINECFSNSIISGSNNGGLIGSNNSNIFGLTVIQNSYFGGTVENGNNSLFGIDINLNNGITIVQNVFSNVNDFDNLNIIKQNLFFIDNINETINNNLEHNGIECIGNKYEINNNIIILNEFLNIPWIKINYTNYNTNPKISILINELSGSGYSLDEFKDYGYSAGEISLMGFSIRELLEKNIYNNGELNIEDYLSENINIENNEIINDFTNYGNKFSYNSLKEENLLNSFISKFIIKSDNNPTISEIKFILTNEFLLTDELRSYLDNNGFIYINGFNNDSVNIYSKYVPNTITLKNDNKHVNNYIIYNGAEYLFGEMLNMRNVTFVFDGIGINSVENNYSGILLRGVPFGSSSGDPHIYPLNGGEKYELPNKVSSYRMVEGNNLIINANTRKIKNSESKEIEDYYKKCNNEEIPNNLMVDGVFYNSIYINSEEASLHYNFDSKELNVNKKGNKYFNYKMYKKEGLKEKEEECCKEIIVLELSFNHKEYGLIKLLLNYYSNPQLKYGLGIQVNKNVNKLSGLLIKEYNCESMELNKITNKYKKYNSLRQKRPNKVLSYHKIY